MIRNRIDLQIKLITSTEERFNKFKFALEDCGYSYGGANEFGTEVRYMFSSTTDRLGVNTKEGVEKIRLSYARTSEIAIEITSIGMPY